MTLLYYSMKAEMLDRQWSCRLVTHQSLGMMWSSMKQENACLYQTIGVLHYLYCSTVLHYYFPVLQCNALQFENMESNAKLHYFFEKVAVQGLHYFFCI